MSRRPLKLTYGELPKVTGHPIAQTIRSLEFLDMKRGPWVAGGAARRALTGAVVEGDIDVFFSRMEDVSVCVKWVQAHLAKHRLTSGRNSVDYKLRNGLNLQFITRRTYASLEELLEDIDYTVCAVATDGWKWACDHRFFDDVENKVLRVNNEEWRAQHLFRLWKYAGYGFHPEPGVLTHVLRMKAQEWLEDRLNISARIMLTGSDY